MKRLLYILPALLLFAAACNKVPQLSDNPISIEITNLQPKNVWFDIIPENNDFYYYFDVCSVAEYDKFSSDASFIKEQDDFLREVYKIVQDFGPTGSFEETCLYRDAIFEAFYGNGIILEPEHDYYVFAYPYDKKGQPIDKLVKVRFTTPSEKHSDITFQLSLEGSVITVVPSNNDKYLFDYDSVADINLSYAGAPSFFFNQMISVYEEYGFMDSMISRGKDSEDMLDFIDIEPGDKVYLGVAGYDNGLTTEVSYYVLTYNGPDLPGTIEPYEEASETKSGDKSHQFLLKYEKVSHLSHHPSSKRI